MGDFFISTQELSGKLARAENLRVFDVRRPPALEATSRFIPGSRWRDHMQTADWIEHIKPGIPVVLTCMHAHNVSQIAGSRLRAAGVDARVLAGGIEGWLSEGLPSIGQSQLIAFNQRDPSVWVTRLGAKVDRVACAWLIRRFIDPDAVFHFVEDEWVIDVAEELGAIALESLEKTAKKGADLSFFDTILRFFDIKDPALDRLALVVQGAVLAAPTGQTPLAPESSGLHAISLGNAARSADDHETLQLGMPVYDALYARLSLAAD